MKERQKKILDEKFTELVQNLNARKKLYWKWYLQNLRLGLVLKMLISAITALLVGDSALRSFNFYPDNGLLAVFASLVTILLYIDTWYNPWSRRRVFLSKNQELDNLCRLFSIRWYDEEETEYKIKLLTETQEKFTTIIQDAAGQ